MAEGFTIKVDDAQVSSALARLGLRLNDMTPVMREIAEQLRTETEENFLREGRPSWLPLAPATVKQRGNAHPILQRLGALARSVTIVYDDTQAGIGTNSEYGAIHQFGGQAGLGRRVTIPARPYLPIDQRGELQPETQVSVLELVNDYLRDALQ